MDVKPCPVCGSPDNFKHSDFMQEMHSTNAEIMARKFHETYERRAPYFEYETRPETRKFDPKSPNGRLMIVVCAEIIEELKLRFKDS